MRPLLGIPFVNRPDLLRAAVESVRALWPHALVVDNSDRGLVAADWPVPLVRPTVPLTFSQSMNCLQRLAATRSCDVLMYMHNDAQAGPSTTERLAGAAAQAVACGRRWGVMFTLYDTLAAMSMNMVRQVGEWDVELPQYFSDNDYYRRVRLAGYEIIETGLPVLHANNGSNTTNSDPWRQFLNSVTFPLYERYYVRKWGGVPGREAYTRPFNGMLPNSA